MKLIEQFKRIERWQERLKKIYKRVPEDMGNLEELDDILAFFQNCHHLKEWIINDDDCQIPNKKKEVENFINKSIPLKLCADLCIGAKHLVIERPRTSRDTHINRHFYLPFGGCINDPFVKRDFKVTSDDKEYDVLILANKCVEEWKKFFNDKGFSWS